MLERSWWLVAACGVVLACAGCGAKTPDTGPPIAVSNAYIEAVVYDLLGRDYPVLALAEPGTCPGHYDVRPSQVRAMRDCKLLLRFDFQSALDRQLERAGDAALLIVPIRLEGGLCEPPTYVEACEQVAEALVAANLARRGDVDRRVAAVQERVATLGAEMRTQIASAGLAGMPVLASEHQAKFGTYLRLNVLADFASADTVLPGEINAAISDGERARLLLANRPEGRRLADALAERLGARVVVLDNFPDVQHHQTRFDEMVRQNVRRLVDAARP